MELYFELHTVAQKESDPPFKPSVQISLKKPPYSDQGVFTPPLVSEQEIDKKIDMLINELEKLRKKAKIFIREKRHS